MTTLLSKVERSDQDVTLLNVWTLLAEQYPDLIALRDPHSQPVFEITYKDLFQQMQWFAAGLQSLGLQPGDRVALIADNNPRWLVADLGSMFTGAVNVPRSSIADPQELGYILRHTGSNALIVENLKTLKRIQPVVSELCLEIIILLSDEKADQDSVLNFLQVIQKGQSHGFKPPQIKRSQLATIIHTSGTGGKPKGVMLSHGNLMHQVENTEVVVCPNPGDKILSILPTWHSYERACEYFLLSKACTLIYTDRRYIKQDLRDEAPHYLIAVPRIWENVYEGIQRQFRQKSAGMQALIKTFFTISERYTLAGRMITNRSIHHYHSTPLQRFWARTQQLLLYPFHRLADALVYRQIRAAVGPNFKYALSGGGALAPFLELFFEMVGIEVLVGYGLTETSPILSARRSNHNVRATSGPPLPMTEFQIVAPETLQPLPQGQKGLIRARGPQIMQGYYNNPEATDKVLSLDGWFNTGDLGWLTPDHQIVITGRAKDVIVLSNGENIEPQPLEDVCSQSPYIDQIVIVGQDQKQLGALIYPNWDMLKAWSQAQGLAIPANDTDLLASDPIRQLLQAELQRQIRNRPGYRSDDQVGPFAFMSEPMSIDNGLLTQTLKVKRLQVAERYQDLISQLFA